MGSVKTCIVGKADELDTCTRTVLDAKVPEDSDMGEKFGQEPKIQSIKQTNFWMIFQKC